MSVTLFPLIQPQAVAVETPLPLYTEVKWDYENDNPVFENGLPVVINGADAVLVWAWKALRTERFRYEIYSWNYGNESIRLVGQPYSEELKRSEATRYARECLLINPYIKDVRDVKTSFSDGQLHVSCKIITVYGEVSVNV